MKICNYIEFGEKKYWTSKMFTAVLKKFLKTLNW